MQRKAHVDRKTSETDISVSLNLDSIDQSTIDSGVPFLDHMLNSMSRHGRFSISLSCKGDTEIDDHHSVEDIGLTLGQVFREALGKGEGITRFGFSSVPMDEALCQVSIDISGRAYFHYTGVNLKGYISQYSEELTLEFLRAFATQAAINLHVNVPYGDNSHHIHEAVFKALGVALGSACAIDPLLKGQIPSTKGSIS